MDTSFLDSKRNFIAVVALAAVLGGLAVAAILGADPTELAVALGAGIATAGIVLGTYTFGRRYGQPHSHAVGTAAVIFGVLYLAAVTFRLLSEWGHNLTTAEAGGAVGIALAATLLVTALTVVIGRVGPSPS